MKNTLLLFLVLLLNTNFLNSQTIQKLDSVHLFSWDSNTNDWRHNTREILTFDNGGNKETNYLRLSLSNSNWVNFYQTLKKYDSNNNLIESIFQRWDTNNKLWNNSSKDSINYSDNKKISEFSYFYFSDKWNEKSNTKYTYDGDKLTEELKQKNNNTFTSMVNDSKIFYIYNGDILIEKAEQKWLEWANIWENDEKIIYEYNSGNLTSETTVGWNASTQVWGTNGYKKTEYSYNSDDLILESITSSFVQTDGVFKGTDKYNYTYSTNQVIATHQQKNLSSDVWKNYAQQIRKNNDDKNLTEHIYQNWNTTINDWRGFLRLLYFWSNEEAAFALSIENQPKLIDASIYPIPAKSNISIKFSETINLPTTLFFYDINGKEIFKKNLKKNQQNINLRLPKLSGSLLFLKIKNKLTTSNYKILLDK